MRALFCCCNNYQSMVSCSYIYLSSPWKGRRRSVNHLMGCFYLVECRTNIRIYLWKGGIRMLIPGEALPYFENQIYLPMLLTILSKDRTVVEKAGFKLPTPYLKLIDRAIDSVQQEMKETADYLRINKMKLIKGKTEDTFTTYIFIYGGYEDSRRYLNFRLKNRTEELLELYLMK